MLLTRASEYALLSIIVIAKSNTPKDTDTLSTILKISKSFLAKILQALAKDNILISYKGAKGGFVLAKKPQDINIYDVVKSVEIRKVNVFDCSVSMDDCPDGGERASICIIWPYLNKLQFEIDSFFKKLHLKFKLKVKWGRGTN